MDARTGPPRVDDIASATDTEEQLQQGDEYEIEGADEDRLSTISRQSHMMIKKSTSKSN